MAYANFAAQLEALRNGVPSSEVFGGGVGGAAGMPGASSGNMGSTMGDMYGQWGIDPNRNYANEQVLKAFGGTNPVDSFYTAKYGSHLATDAAGNTSQLAYRPPGLVGGTGPQPGSAPGAGGGMGGFGGGSGGSGGLGSGYGMSTNPYEGAQADAIRQQSQDLFGNLNNQITSSAVGVGGLGGSRQGVAQGVAQGQAQNYLQSNLANLYGGNWNADQNRALQQYGYDQNFYTNQRQLDQSGAALGANLYNQGTMGQWGPINAAGGVYSNYTGNGNTTVNTSGGGGVTGGIGGALSGATLGRSMGWW